MHMSKFSIAGGVALCLFGGLIAGLFIESRFHTLAGPAPAEAIMARVGRTFVMAAEPPKDRRVGQIYYAAPKPYGASWLCRVDVISIAPWIVWDYAKPADASFENDIEVRRMYGINGRPGTDVPDQTYERSCDGFREFEHLIHVDDGEDPHRAVFVLDRIISAVRASENPLKIECTDRRSALKPLPCDGEKVIGKLTLKDITQTRQVSERSSDKLTALVDNLYFDEPRRSNEHPKYTLLEVESVQVVGQHSIDEPDVRAVHVYLDVM